MASDRRTDGRLEDHPDQLRAAFGRARRMDACCRTCLCSCALDPTRVAKSSPLRHQRHRAQRAIRRSPDAHRELACAGVVPVHPYGASSSIVAVAMKRQNRRSRSSHRERRCSREGALPAERKDERSAGTTRPWTNLRMLRNSRPFRRHQTCRQSIVRRLRRYSTASRPKKTSLLRHNPLPTSFASNRASTTSSGLIASSVCAARGACCRLGAPPRAIEGFSRDRHGAVSLSR